MASCGQPDDLSYWLRRARHARYEAVRIIPRNFKGPVQIWPSPPREWMEMADALGGWGVNRGGGLSFGPNGFHAEGPSYLIDELRTIMKRYPNWRVLNDKLRHKPYRGK